MGRESRASAVVQVRDAGVEIEEALCSLSSPETALPSLVSSCRTVEVLEQVVATGRGDDLNVLHAVEQGKFPKCCAVTPELVRMDDLRHVIFTQQSTEEQSSSLGIAVLLKSTAPCSSTARHNQYLTPPTSTHRNVQMPPRTPTGFPVAQTLGEEVTELDAPGLDGFADYCDPPFQQEFFDIAVAQGEPVA